MPPNYAQIRNNRRLRLLLRQRVELSDLVGQLPQMAAADQRHHTRGVTRTNRHFVTAPSAKLCAHAKLFSMTAITSLTLAVWLAALPT